MNIHILFLDLFLFFLYDDGLESNTLLPNGCADPGLSFKFFLPFRKRYGGDENVGSIKCGVLILPKCGCYSG